MEDDLLLKGMESQFSLIYPYLTEKGIEANKRFLKKLEQGEV